MEISKNVINISNNKLIFRIYRHYDDNLLKLIWIGFRSQWSKFGKRKSDAFDYVKNTISSGTKNVHIVFDDGVEYNLKSHVVSRVTLENFSNSLSYYIKFLKESRIDGYKYESNHKTLVYAHIFLLSLNYDEVSKWKPDAKKVGNTKGIIKNIDSDLQLFSPSKLFNKTLTIYKWHNNISNIASILSINDEKNYRYPRAIKVGYIKFLESDIEDRAILRFVSTKNIDILFDDKIADIFNYELSCFCGSAIMFKSKNYYHQCYEDGLPFLNRVPKFDTQSVIIAGRTGHKTVPYGHHISLKITYRTNVNEDISNIESILDYDYSYLVFGNYQRPSVIEYEGDEYQNIIDSALSLVG